MQLNYKYLYLAYLFVRILSQPACNRDHNLCASLLGYLSQNVSIDLSREFVLMLEDGLRRQISVMVNAGNCPRMQEHL